MNEGETVRGVLPPSGAVSWYVDFLKLFESRRVPRVDEAFLQDQRIARSNESRFTSGLRFLGLVDEDLVATDAMNSLSLKGEQGRRNLETVVRNAYSLLFQKDKIDLETAEADTLTNFFETDYNMGSPTTAKQAAQIFVYLAQKAGIALSESIREKLVVSPEKQKATKRTAEARPKTRPEKAEVSKTSVEGLTTQLPEGVMARFISRDGHIDIKDKESFESLKGHIKLLSKRLGIPEEESRTP